MDIELLKNKIIDIGRLLWDKGLVTGYNGNISLRVGVDQLLITGSGTCLGYLKTDAIVLINMAGEMIEPKGEAKPSSETLMHTAIYKNFPEIQAVVHTHSTYTNGFFLANERFSPKTFEAKFYLGDVRSVPQSTPSVTDIAPVIHELKSNNIVVLRQHGVVAMGPDLFRAFVLIQELEEQVKMDVVAQHYAQGIVKEKPVETELSNTKAASKKYKLFSVEQIEEIVRIVNTDTQMQTLGLKTAMTMSLAVCLDETGAVYSFNFENGRIVNTAHDTGAEFLITANETIWRAVFNREIDPFVATTQKKMHLRGDFARISKWYAPCSRIFQLWTQVPVD